MAKKPRITVLQPDPEVPLDRFDEWLRAGVRISLISLWDKDVPNLETIGDGLVVLGGRMSCHADERWVDQVKDLMADAMDIDIPVLGICLGHQLLAEALGGEVVEAHPSGPEDGPVGLVWAPEATDDPVLGAVAASGAPVPMSHNDSVTRLPEGATELAWSPTYRNAAFRVGPAVGVQFHPEASPELIQHWWTKKHGGKSTALLDRMRAVDDQVAPAMRSIAEGFTGVVVENA